jgi:cysteinyl-tRNA synthetase
LSAAGAALHARFVDAIDADLDLPAALVTVREMLRADLPADERRWLVLDADAVLGLDLHRVWEGPADPDVVPADVRALVDARDAARAGRDYARADALRAEIGAAGYDVIDSPEGSSVRPRR